LDVHRDFCEVAIVEAGEVRSGGRIETTPASLELFAQSLCASDRVVLEVTGNAWEIARILEPHVGEVLVVHPGDTGIRQARAKTDRLDARALARLLAAGSLDGLWMPDEQTRALRRRLARRSQLVRARTRAKNECHAVLVRRLIKKPAVSDLFGLAGREWLREVELPTWERETVDGCLGQIEFLDQEIAEVEKQVVRDALTSPADQAADDRPGRERDRGGDVSRRGRRCRPLPRSAPACRLAGPRSARASIWQHTGDPRPDLKARLSVRAARARRGIVERRPPAGPAARLLPAHPRSSRPSGRGCCRRAQARLPVLVHAHPRRGLRLRAAVADKKKLRRLELQAGAERGKVKAGIWSTNVAMRQAERELARQAEQAYQRTVADWHSTRGAGATPGRASQGRQSGKQRGKALVPDPAP
jgi:transposase